MAFDPKDIIKGVVKKPRKLVIYGKTNIGKSSLAGAAKDCFMIATEDRVAHIDCFKTEVAENYQYVLDAIDFILKGKHDFKTLAIDTTDWLETMLHQYVCKQKGFTSLTNDKDKETMFSKGLKYHATDEWKNFLQLCDKVRDERNMNIIFVSHCMITNIKPPDRESYDKYTLKTDKHASALIEEWSDIIGFYQKEVITTSEDMGFNKDNKRTIVAAGDKRILHLKSTSEAFIAENSYGLENVQVTMENKSDVMDYILGTETPKQTKTTGDK